MRKQSTLLKMVSIGVGFALIVGGGLFAVPRATGQTQGEMNRTSGKDYEKADAEMNKAYRQLIAKLSTKQKSQLKTAQLAWIKFRDAESLFLSGKVEGGSVYPTIYATHKAAVTRQRTQELRQALKLYTTEGDM